jgi:hypothetical protein
LKNFYQPKSKDLEPDQLCIGLHQFLNGIVADKKKLFNDHRALSSLAKFLAPYQEGDERAPGFSMPLPIN